MKKNFRKRLLTRLAQNNINVNDINITQNVSGTPPGFISTDYYSIILAFTPKNAVIINTLTNTLNLALFYASNGKIHLPWMKSVNWNFDTSNIKDIDLKNLMLFSKQLFNTLFTDTGAQYSKQLSSTEIANKINTLKNSQYLTNISGTNPMGQMATKIGGNIKTLITNYLSQIK